MLKQHGHTPACINTMNEVLQKNFGHLTLKLQDKHLFNGIMGTRMLQNILDNFKGEKLTLSDCLTKGVNFSNMFY
jgi:hypothetical protein